MKLELFSFYFIQMLLIYRTHNQKEKDSYSPSSDFIKCSCGNLCSLIKSISMTSLSPLARSPVPLLFVSYRIYLHNLAQFIFCTPFRLDKDRIIDIVPFRSYLSSLSPPLFDFHAELRGFWTHFLSNTDFNWSLHSPPMSGHNSPLLLLTIWWLCLCSPSPSLLSSSLLSPAVSLSWHAITANSGAPSVWTLIRGFKNSIWPDLPSQHWDHYNWKCWYGLVFVLWPPMLDHE